VTYRVGSICPRYPISGNPLPPSFFTINRLSFTPCDSPLAFAQLFLDNGAFKGKKVVLVIDEFDHILLNDIVKRDVLNIFRHIKLNRNYCIHAVVIIGPFSLVQMASDTSKLRDNMEIEGQTEQTTNPTDSSLLSPFNIRDCLQILFLSQSEVLALFKQFEVECQEKIDDLILKDIFLRTNGHKGLVCFLGKLLDERLRVQGKLPTYEQWRVALSSRLTSFLIEYPTMCKLVESLTASTSFAKQVRSILNKYFLPFPHRNLRMHNKTEEYPYVQFLAAEGALTTPVGALDVFTLASPIVHQTLLNKVSVVDKRSFPSCAAPLTSSYKIDFPKLLKTALPFFNKEIIKKAFTLSFKRNQAPGYKRDAPVPEEATYHFELGAILSTWLPFDLFYVLTEVNSDPETPRARCDLQIVHQGEPISMYLEFAASLRTEDIVKHFEKLSHWKSVQPGVYEAWTIVFSLSQLAPPVWPRPELGIHCVYVHHDTTFDFVNVYFQNTPRLHIFIN